MGNLRVIEGGAARPTDMGLATYIWVSRRGDICSRTKVISIAQTPEGDHVPLIDRWKMVDQVQAREKSQTLGPRGYEDSHTYQDRLTSEEFILSPCYYVPDPQRPQPSFLVLCEVRTLEDDPDSWNTRAILRKHTEGEALLPHWGIQQPFPYLGEGVSDHALKEEFTLNCFDAGIRLHSVDARHYWIGPRNVSNEIDVEEPCSLVIADHLILARFLYQRLYRHHGHTPQKQPWGSCDICLSTEKSRKNPEEVKTLQAMLHNLQFQSPGVPGEGSPHYQDLIHRSRGLRQWDAVAGQGISVKDQTLNYVRLYGLPSNADIYEAMSRILQVLLAAQKKPSENPDTTEG